MIYSRFTRLMLSGGAAFALLGGSLHASPIPANLGNGLDKLLASHLAFAAAANDSTKRPKEAVEVQGKQYADKTVAAIASNSTTDDQGRVLVRVTLNGQAAFKATRKAMKAAAASLSITAADKKYRGVGVMNAYVALEDVPALAKAPGVAAVILEWKPRHNKINMDTALASGGNTVVPGTVLNKLGTAFDQGVLLHRIDSFNQGYNPSATLDYEGQGMKIACLSNSFASHSDNPPVAVPPATQLPNNGPAIDVANGDLPGPANPYNTTAVYVLQDDAGAEASSDDEGRAMCQIVYKMAPKSSIAFATADSGEVGFANNIRLLGGLTVNGVTGTFNADSICDDVGYFDEPFFQDGIIGDGIDDVAAAGIAYFSSAANDIGTNGYDSATRWVANGTGMTSAGGNTALAGTNIDLTNVPAALYAGGFHNFKPNGLDVAQTVNIAANNTVPVTLQWNDPYDQTTSTIVTATLLSTSATYTTTDLVFPVSGTVTAGTSYQFIEAATAGSTFDGIVTVYKSDGTTVLAGPQDTGTDETVRLIAPANDTGFVVKVGHFGTTTGNFTLTVSSFNGFTTPAISTSVSLLVFNATTGAYLPNSSLTTDATATNQPIQLGYTNRPAGTTQVQYVFARSSVPAANAAFPTHVRYLLPGNGRAGYGPAEYFTYNTVTTGGHAMAEGCNGTAAYDSFRPNLPAYFSSPGPVTIYYDKSDNRLSTPQVRLQPRIAADNAANISANMSFFASDTGSDPDTDPNFSGTSAAAPHAAAIGALVVQAHGGRHSITPTQLTSILERSTYPHDLDPNFASGSARVIGGTKGAAKITVSISSDNSPASTTGLTATGGNDTHAFAISYIGGSNVTSFVFNPGGTAATGGNVTGGNNGVTLSTESTGGTATYFENTLPGVAFLTTTKLFTQPTSGTVTATAVPSSPSSTAAGQYYTLTLTPTSTFAGGGLLYFTVGRGPATAATTGSTPGSVTNATSASANYSADLFGGGVALPSGTVTTAGMTFNGTTADGGQFSGVIKNNIGSGWATQDGYGLINAETAITQPAQ